MEKILITLFILILIALILNLPFGYLRSTVRKFSLSWFLYIHIPIPVVILMRLWLGFSYKAIPLILIGSMTGQLLGGYFNKGRQL
ncbi:MAG: hypothetical protein A3G39_09460 [Deltaproteobacteria bacterium RIFCSPLOWO2_12_FULL_43_16]|nr:MAG: hypothetical protein A2Z89_05100 [Deltaproteobacteria bacterium GWA2_43_19]OGQ09996.1 MAG: hypothetical protein A3D30_06520 [Deltaproteobacteria bacterium RIFCSPHIGHO2_02_FULL_43_33]OGQ38857.1 MAG: hypothetical protein A3A85_06845 [Deltaproteobacteria bacterium RIFCSPLOWO2_01_FULL_42_9]OGQ58685.1 MAG: hypothetical protein A3G39_09460 [Deltaproteobacteria bacterium RIFCSPLOWO2_12_FULL_43_16]HBR16691.1 hypothetical protein [Deltaproteobacteria bacterium]